MITCYIQYQIDPNQIAAFEAYGKVWIALVERFGGRHHGYFMPHESPNDFAVAMFSFNSLADYERYRIDSMQDPECQRAYAFSQETQCIKRYDRYFLRPTMQGQLDAIDVFKRQAAQAGKAS
jgi:NIPSNAP